MNKKLIIALLAVAGVLVLRAPVAHAATTNTDNTDTPIVCNQKEIQTEKVVAPTPVVTDSETGAPLAPNTELTTPSVNTFDDGDSVPAPVEDAAPAHPDTTVAGDNNADGTPDSCQSTVATAPNPNDVAKPDSYVTLEVLPNQGQESTNWVITNFAPVSTTDIGNVPTDRTFPIGLFDLTLQNHDLAFDLNIYNNNCLNLNTDSNPMLVSICSYFQQQIDQNKTATVRLLLDRVVDHSKWLIEQYSYVLGKYSDYSANAVVKDETVGFLRTTITWTLADGGKGDQDAQQNGVILDSAQAPNGSIADPIGPSVKNPVVVNPVITVASVVTPRATLVNTGSDSTITGLMAIVLLVTTLGVSVAAAKKN